MKAHTAIALVTATLMSCSSAYAKHPKPSEFGNAEIRVAYKKYVDAKLVTLGLDVPDERRNRLFL